MRKFLISLVFIQISIAQYGQIIADHTVVDKFDKIPQQYITAVKKMWLSYAGESHAEGIGMGMDLLEASHPKFAVNVTGYPATAPEVYTSIYLRVCNLVWGDYNHSSGWQYNTGEGDWWTNTAAVARIKAGLSYCNSTGPSLSAIGFGWCWDAIGLNKTPSATVDPLFGCHWYGSSEYGPQGDLSWGIDATDNTITMNSVNTNTYLSATQAYIDYCTANNIATKVFFTTGPVDNNYGDFTSEAMYQATLKYQHIRDYVAADASRILFDYADILSYNDDGSSNSVTWSGHTYKMITATNLGNGQYAHIGSAGVTRLAKAMWWMLARIAGWDGSTTTGIDELNKGKSLSALFEIRQNELRIKLDDSNLSATINLYNLQGSLVSAKKADSDMCIFDISQLPSGIYLVSISKSNSINTQKVIIP